MDRKRDRAFGKAPVGSGVVGPSQNGYPWGARILLEKDAPATALYRVHIARKCRLKLSAIPYLPDMRSGCETADLSNLRLWLAARFSFMFDAEIEPEWAGDISQSKPLAEAFQELFGFDYETVVSALALVAKHARMSERKRWTPWLCKSW